MKTDLEFEAERGSIMQDALECIIEETEGNAKEVAQETLESIAIMDEQRKKRS